MKRVALLVGVDRYLDGLPRLSSPTGDVHALGNTLERIGKFNVKTILNPSARELNTFLHKHSRDLSSEDTLLVYFSGHGIKDERGRLYLAATDTERDVPHTGIYAPLLTQSLDENDAAVRLLVLDCCYSGAFQRGAKGEAPAEIAKEDFSPEDKQAGVRGFVVLTSGSASQLSFEGAESARGLSHFTRGLVDGLTDESCDENRDGKISVDELHKYISPRVKRQTPQLWKFGTTGDIVLGYVDEIAASRHSSVPAQVVGGRPLSSAPRPLERSTRVLIGTIAVAVLPTVAGIAWSASAARDDARAAVGRLVNCLAYGSPGDAIARRFRIAQLSNYGTTAIWYHNCAGLAVDAEKLLRDTGLDSLHDETDHVKGELQAGDVDSGALAAGLARLYEINPTHFGATDAPTPGVMIAFDSGVIRKPSVPAAGELHSVSFEAMTGLFSVHRARESDLLCRFSGDLVSGRCVPIAGRDLEPIGHFDRQPLLRNEDTGVVYSNYGALSLSTERMVEAWERNGVSFALRSKLPLALLRKPAEGAAPVMTEFSYSQIAGTPSGTLCAASIAPPVRDASAELLAFGDEPGTTTYQVYALDVTMTGQLDARRKLGDVQTCGGSRVQCAQDDLFAVWMGANDLFIRTGSEWSARIAAVNRGTIAKLICDKKSVRIVSRTASSIFVEKCSVSGCEGATEFKTNVVTGMEKPRNLQVVALGDQVAAVWDAGPDAGIRVKIATEKELDTAPSYVLFDPKLDGQVLHAAVDYELLDVSNIGGKVVVFVKSDAGLHVFSLPDTRAISFELGGPPL